MNTSGEQKHNGLEERMRKISHLHSNSFKNGLKMGKHFGCGRANDKKQQHTREFSYHFLNTAIWVEQQTAIKTLVQALTFRRKTLNKYIK